jgi:hypothetical protein
MYTAAGDRTDCGQDATVLAAILKAYLQNADLEPREYIEGFLW